MSTGLSERFSLRPASSSTTPNPNHVNLNGSLSRLNQPKPDSTAAAQQEYLESRQAASSSPETESKRYARILERTPRTGRTVRRHVESGKSEHASGPSFVFVQAYHTNVLNRQDTTLLAEITALKQENAALKLENSDKKDQVRKIQANWEDWHDKANKKLTARNTEIKDLKAELQQQKAVTPSAPPLRTADIERKLAEALAEVEKLRTQNKADLEKYLETSKELDQERQVRKQKNKKHEQKLKEQATLHAKAMKDKAESHAKAIKDKEESHAEAIKRNDEVSNKLKELNSQYGLLWKKMCEILESHPSMYTMPDRKEGQASDTSANPGQAPEPAAERNDKDDSYDHNDKDIEMS